MSKLPSMPFFPADFFAATRHLTYDEQALHLMMIIHAWPTGGELPDDEVVICRILRISRNKFNALKKNVLPYWHRENEILFNRRSRENFREILGKHEVNKANGALGGRPKSLFSHDAAKPNGLFPETERKGNQNQNQNHNKVFNNGSSRKEGGWVPTKRIGNRTFKVGEFAPQYEGQAPANWKQVTEEDCT